MQASDLPLKLPIPFAQAGTRNVIPASSQIGIVPGQASLIDGFPPLTFIALSAGGIPPEGADFNGILFEISAWSRWQSAGGGVPYDAAFQAAISGYPKGAVLISADATHFWLSSTDNNVTNPDASGAGWSAIGPFGNIMSLNVGAGLQAVGGFLEVVAGPNDATLYVLGVLQ